MGCGSSAPVPPPTSTPPNGGGGGAPTPPPVKAPSAGESRNIDNDLERAKQEEEGKIKMLLLGAGESGKSTIFKQMRLLYGTERSDDDLRMYGVVARSNIVVATRKLCSHLRNLGLEEELDRESRENEELEAGDHSSMNCRQAYDELMAYLVDNTATASAQDPNGSAHDNAASGGGGINSGNDWVGSSPRAGLAANNDAKQFLAHHESIRILWQVSKIVICFWCIYMPLFYSCLGEGKRARLGTGEGRGKDMPSLHLFGGMRLFVGEIGNWDIWGEWDNLTCMQTAGDDNGLGDEISCN